MSRRTLLNWGSYDVDNFGDLLFPFIVERFLGRNYGEVIHVSPTGTRSKWADAKPTCTIAEALRHGGTADLVVGGGNLVSFTASSSFNYVEDKGFAAIVHPSFSWVPYILRAKHGIPYAFNLVGVTKAIPPDRHEEVVRIMAHASFLSCRDTPSVGHLRRCGVTAPIIVSPDSALGIPKVFPRKVLDRHYREEACEKYRIPAGKRTAVVHVKSRYLGGQISEVARIVSVLAQRGLHSVLIPLGLCHGDDVVLSDEALTAGPATCIVRPELLIDMLSILARSEVYIGSSLHGAITSLSYGNRVVIVADEKRSGLAKFSGFLAQLNLVNCLFDGWRAAGSRLTQSGLDMFAGISAEHRQSLVEREDVWGIIQQRLRTAPGPRPTLEHDRAMERSVLDYYGI